MATITIEIKDGYEIQLGKSFGGLSYPPDKIPSNEEHLDAIKSKFEELLSPHYDNAIKEDHAVIAKEAELKALIEQKRDSIKGK